MPPTPRTAAITELAATESLPAQQLKIILLRDLEEPTIAEIPERLDIHVSAVKGRLHRARGFVHEHLLGSSESTMS